MWLYYVLPVSQARSMRTVQCEIISLIKILIVFQWFIYDIIWDYLNGFVGTKYLNVLGFLFYMF